MQKAIWAVIVVIVILLIGLGFYSSQKDTTLEDNSINQAENSPPGPPSLNEISTTNPQTYSISIKDFAFSPKSLTIKAGDKVIWLNEDTAPHTVTSTNNQELDSGTMSRSETYEHTFNSLGSYEYYCALHPRMTGKIIVE